ncbi:Cof-type HAD-IIB family hydrolase [Chromobacterium sp. IIBBL 290-4]|uniref:Cof-type HAD-IIB family hydrolase n=1 Tax=Chromobacterium sp. IIBBL 290-4 TaxID=2953890 RepID=UPI0020B7DA25|nr:Cof-type HAD-IIB family hydrolase [Chromobacterium sp. IIBBL 290-4]UTH75085.1 Cof-type HAD-IIB family hydrolase [Chromobacterium sp. IIBBL 290-4]
MPYRLIATDLDGTLLDQHHAVTPLTAATLQALRARGVALVLATGRHYRDVRAVREALGVPAYLISSNGARVHGEEDELIFGIDIEAELVREISAPEFSGDVAMHYFMDENWLANRRSPLLDALIREEEPPYAVADLQGHGGEGVYKVLYVAPHEHLLGLERVLRERYGDRLYITFSLDFCLEVMAAGVSKGEALKLVLDKLGLAAETCIAFGDGQNDVELLRTAGHPRLMGNAHARLRGALPDAEQIYHHADSGMARHLREAFALAD